MNSRINTMKLRAGVIMTMLSIMMFPAFDAMATHIVGGSISYDCVGTNVDTLRDLEFSLTVRRDCDNADPEAEFDPIAHIGVFDFNFQPVTNPLYGFVNGRIEIPRPGSDTLMEDFNSGCEVLGEEVCVQQIIYRGLHRNIRQHPSGGYIFVYQRCCRNVTLTNVLDPLNSGMTVVARVSNGELFDCNRTPDFPDFPPIYACVGVPVSFDQGAGVDPDGDELRYRLYQPLLGLDSVVPVLPNPTPPPYQDVIWNPPHDLSNLMNSGMDPSINATTGELTFTADHIGQYLVGICIEEWRDDRLYNTTCREFEINTRACGDPAVAILNPTDTIICDQLTIDFSSAGSIADSLSYDYGDGSEPDPSGTHTFPGPGDYWVKLWAVNDNGCYDVDSSLITLLNSGAIENDFTVEMLECVDTIIVKVTDQNEYDTLNPPISIDWDVSIGAVSIASDTGSMFTFGLETSAEVTICQYTTLANGCELEQCRTEEFNLLELDFDDDITLCLDEPRTITVMHAAGDDITVDWTDPSGIITTNNGTSVVVETSDSISTKLYFTATNEFGCSTSDSIMVSTAGRRPALSFFVMQECGSLKISTVNTSADSVAVVWDFGDGSGPVTDWEPMHTYASAGTYTISLSGGMFPCDTTVEMTVTIPIIDIDLPDTVYQCFDEAITLNPGGNSDWIYDWSPNDLFSDTAAVSPSILVTEPTTVYVTITVFDGDNFCVHNDSIFVFPVPDFQFDVDPAGDVTICGEENTITMSVLTMDGVDVTWKDINGMVLFEGDTFSTVLEEGLNQFIVMGVYMGVEECMKSDTINVTLNQIELSFEIINLDDGTDMFCEPAPGKLIVNVDGPPGNYEYQWAPADGVTAGLNNDTLCIDVSGDITYCVTVTNTDLDCSVDGCYTIEFGADVVATVLDADGIVCVGDKVTVVATIDPQGADCSYNWSVPGTIIGPSDQDTICYTATSSGTVIVSVGCVGGCTSSDSVFVEVRDLNALISVSVDPDTMTFDGQIIQLDAVGGEEDWTYDWEGEGLVEPSNIKSPTADPGPIGDYTYTVMVVDEFGCEATASGTVRRPRNVPCEHPYVFVPTGFSPNNDGENDELRVYGIDIDVIEEFIVYNRWGQEVFRVVDAPSASWNGTYNGDDLEADVYGYYLRVLCINGDRSTQQGNINLLR